jgi:hypothetical protein
VWTQIVGAFVALSALDLALTLRLTDLGAIELNPLMSAFLEAGWLWAAAFKAAITVGVAAGLWFGRHHRLVRQTAIGFVAVFLALVSYQVTNLLLA